MITMETYEIPLQPLKTNLMEFFPYAQIIKTNSIATDILHAFFSNFSL